MKLGLSFVVQCIPLTIPALSDSFKWTASAIVSKNAKVPLYIILAKEPPNKLSAYIICMLSHTVRKGHAIDCSALCMPLS